MQIADGWHLQHSLTSAPQAYNNTASPKTGSPRIEIPGGGWGGSGPNSPAPGGISPKQLANQYTGSGGGTGGAGGNAYPGDVSALYNTYGRPPYTYATNRPGHGGTGGGATVGKQRSASAGPARPTKGSPGFHAGTAYLHDLYGKVTADKKGTGGTSTRGPFVKGKPVSSRYMDGYHTARPQTALATTTSRRWAGTAPLFLRTGYTAPCMLSAGARSRCCALRPRGDASICCILL